MEIWINPACSKCRTAVDALDQAGSEYTIRRYLEDPPTAEEIQDVVARMGLEPWDIIRMNEPEVRAAGLRDLPKDAEHRAGWIAAMVKHPKLIQRPIITADDGTTVIARDPATLDTVIKAEGGR